jgi:hypothetical protein
LLYPNFQSRAPTGRTFQVTLPRPPKLLGRKKQDNKVDNKSTIMTVGLELFSPMRWYLTQLRWSPPGPQHHGTSDVELALDFEAATGVGLRQAGTSGDRSLRQKAATFREAARRVSALCGGPPTPGSSVNNCHALSGMKWPEAPGWECRAHLMCPASVLSTLAAWRADRLAASGMRSAAFDVHPPWKVRPGNPLWHDERSSHNITATTSRRKNGQASAGPLAKAARHNDQRKEDRHCILVSLDGKELSCSTCELWAPARQLQALAK